MDPEWQLFHSRRLDRSVRTRYPVDFRSRDWAEGDRLWGQIIDHEGGALLAGLEVILYPALKRLRSLQSAAYMRRTVLGTSDNLELEIGMGIWSYTLGVYPFYPERVPAILDLQFKRLIGAEFQTMHYSTTMDTIGALVDLPEGLSWLHVPDERWRAAPRPELIDVTGLPPVHDVVIPLFDSILRRVIEEQVAFRRKHGFPVEPADLAAWRRERLLREPG